MSDLLKKAISLGFGITAVGRDKVQQFVDELIAIGELGKAESSDVVNRLIAQGEAQQNEIKQMVREQVKKVLDEFDVATKQDLREMELRMKPTEQPPSAS